ARRAEVRAERAAEQYLRDLRRFDVEVSAEQVPAGGDRRLRELELAYVALREVDVVAEVEDVLLADLAEARRRVEDEAPGVVEHLGPDELRDRVDQPRAAQADGRDVTDDRQLDLAVDDPHALDSAVGGAHAAADL